MNGARNASMDYVEDSFLAWSVEAYTNSGQLDVGNPYITPLGSPSRSETPIWLHVGGLERLCDAAVRFAEEMREVESRLRFSSSLWPTTISCSYVGNVSRYASETSGGPCF